MIDRRPKCRHCKERFVPKYFLQPFCLKDDACKVAAQEWAMAEVRKKADKDFKQWKEKMKPSVYSKKYKSQLQSEINKLARMIDMKFYDTCIDCGRPFGNQIDGSHYHNVGSHNSTRWNLHNIHAAKSDCNQFHGGKKEGYSSGLAYRYGADYFQMVLSLPQEYSLIKLSENEVVEKLKIVRKLIRDFDTFEFETASGARNILNNLIGIYK